MCSDTCIRPRDVEKLMQSARSRFVGVNKSCVFEQSGQFHKLSNMTAANQMFFEDRSDVPDLLRYLADCPFPAFDDSGKHVLK